MVPKQIGRKPAARHPSLSDLNTEPVHPDEPEFVAKYDDFYDACIYPSFGALSSVFALYVEGTHAALNVPVWVDWMTEERATPTVEIGLLLTRHGLPMIWTAPATLDQFHEIQVRMLHVWAARADGQFRRGGFPAFVNPDGSTEWPRQTVE